MKYLHELDDLVKKIWPHSDKWRLNHDQIEFSIQCIYGIEWFPIYRAPVRIEKFVYAWLKSGGLNSESDNVK